MMFSTVDLLFLIFFFFNSIHQLFLFKLSILTSNHFWLVKWLVLQVYYTININKIVFKCIKFTVLLMSFIHVLQGMLSFDVNGYNESLDFNIETTNHN